MTGTKDRAAIPDGRGEGAETQSGLRLYIPRPEDGWFYVKMMSDPATMAYNAPWFPPDGCIPEPEAEWQRLVRSWIGREPRRFYAYLQRISDGAFVGDVNYHENPARGWHDLGIVIHAPGRGDSPSAKSGPEIPLENNQRTRYLLTGVLKNPLKTARAPFHTMLRAVRLSPYQQSSNQNS